MIATLVAFLIETIVSMFLIESMNNKTLKVIPAGNIDKNKNINNIIAINIGKNNKTIFHHAIEINIYSII